MILIFRSSPRLLNYYDFFKKNQGLKITDFFDLAALELTSAITSAAKTSIPISRLGARAKPWWNPELLDLRKTMLREQRGITTSKLPYLQAKKDHWNQFLEKEDPKSIFKALAYTKNRLVEKIPPISNKTDFYDKCKVFRETLFPTPPSAPEPTWDRYRPYNWNWPSLARSELENACSAKIKGKTPGPDLINQDIIR